MDELAELAAADPLDFRLQHLDEGRLKDVLQAATEKFDWPRRRTERTPNRGVGVGMRNREGFVRRRVRRRWKLSTGPSVS